MLHICRRYAAAVCAIASCSHISISYSFGCFFNDAICSFLRLFLTLALTLPCLRVLIPTLPLPAGMSLPFFLGAVNWTTCLSLDAAPESRKQDRRVRMEAHVPTLLPGDKTAAAYVRAIAGSHYRAKTDQLIISCDKHVDTGMNRREILEKLVTLVSEAQRLGREYGPFPRIKRLPQYTH